MKIRFDNTAATFKALTDVCIGESYAIKIIGGTFNVPKPEKQGGREWVKVKSKAVGGPWFVPLEACTVIRKGRKSKRQKGNTQ